MIGAEKESTQQTLTIICNAAEIFRSVASTPKMIAVNRYGRPKKCPPKNDHRGFFYKFLN